MHVLLYNLREERSMKEGEFHCQGIEIRVSQHLIGLKSLKNAAVAGNVYKCIASNKRNLHVILTYLMFAYTHLNDISNPPSIVFDYFFGGISFGAVCLLHNLLKRK